MRSVVVEHTGRSARNRHRIVIAHTRVANAVSLALTMKHPARIVVGLLFASLVVPVTHARATDSTIPGTTVPDTVPTTTEAPTTTTSLPAVSPPQRKRVNIAFARVVLDEQRAYFYNKNRRLIATLPVSTGVDDQTPVGVFKVFSKSAQTFYTPNPRERMRFMTRFTVGREGGNIGFHGIPYTVTKSGEVPFYTPLGIAPSSHGCIRMRVADAKWVFQNMPLGATVSVLRTRR
jgi:lipoprotein-anchoring transpeptidase ErfK/SrfK